jgi:hypothetical protein
MPEIIPDAAISQFEIPESGLLETEPTDCDVDMRKCTWKGVAGKS